MQFNYFLIIAVSALVPLVVGLVWYHPKVLGTAWMKASKLDEAKMREGFSLAPVLGLTYVFGLFIAVVLSGVVIHQMGFSSMLQKHWLESETQQRFAEMMDIYGADFRSFKHGALHGLLVAIGIALPVVTINGMFERRGFQYIIIHIGYWIISLMVMGGIICQFADISGIK